MSTLIMYSRRLGCPFVTLAKRVLADYQVPYREIYIDVDQAARARVVEWTGFLSVPTLVIAHDDGDLPYEVPPPLPKGASPRGINRGAMITEPGESQLLEWLRQHCLVELADPRLN